MRIIEVNNIKKTFQISAKQRKINRTNDKFKVAISDISFYVEKGEIYGLLGSNGAGKTTTLRCLATLIKPDHGTIFIDGVSTDNDLEIRKKICFLTNELKLEDQFTPSYLFTYFSRFHNIQEDKIEERKKDLFDRFGITKFAETKIGDLSTGMKQKVSIAVSLVHDPEIIVFDEPTNGLDVITAKVVTDYLLELKKLGKTIIISTHIMSLVEKLCDRVGIIVNGKIKVSDKTENVRKMSPNNDLEDVFFKFYNQEMGENYE